jgi:hypothetical protein
MRPSCSSLLCLFDTVILSSWSNMFFERPPLFSLFFFFFSYAPQTTLSADLLVSLHNGTVIRHSSSPRPLCHSAMTSQVSRIRSWSRFPHHLIDFLVVFFIYVLLCPIDPSNCFILYIRPFFIVQARSHWVFLFSSPLLNLLQPSFYFVTSPSNLFHRSTIPACHINVDVCIWVYVCRSLCGNSRMDPMVLYFILFYFSLPLPLPLLPLPPVVVLPQCSSFFLQD